jgi:hypothetical protein
MHHASLLEPGTRTAFQVQPLVAPAHPLVPPGAYQPLIEKLAEIRRERGSGVIAAFSSVSRGDGVTYVVESLAWELAKQTGEQTLLATPGGLGNAASARFTDLAARFTDTGGRWPVSHPVHRLSSAGGTSARWDDSAWQDFQGLRHRFGYSLVDCPAVCASPAALSVCRACDGVVLVVTAGRTERKDIQRAKSMLQVASANLLGLVLNKRVEPVPGFIASLLA